MQAPLPASHDAHRSYRRRFGWRGLVGLIWVLSRKNFQVKYKRAVLGMLWAVIQPAFQAAFLTFVFIKLFHIDRVPNYPMYVLSGILPWSFFSMSLNAATSSVVDNAGLVRKVAIPLQVFPFSAIGGTAMAFSSSMGVLVVAGLFFGDVGPQVLLLPVAVVLEFFFIAGVGLITSAFQVAFRDVKLAVESLLIVGMYGSPIMYDLDKVSPTIRPFIRANPMTGLLTLYRAAILSRPIDFAAVWSSLVGIALLLLVGLAVFRRRCGEFADLV